METIKYYALVIFCSFVMCLMLFVDNVLAYTDKSSELITKIDTEYNINSGDYYHYSWTLLNSGNQEFGVLKIPLTERIAISSYTTNPCKVFTKTSVGNSTIPMYKCTSANGTFYLYDNTTFATNFTTFVPYISGVGSNSNVSCSTNIPIFLSDDEAEQYMETGDYTNAVNFSDVDSSVARVDNYDETLPSITDLVWVADENSYKEHSSSHSSSQYGDSGYFSWTYSDNTFWNLRSEFEVKGDIWINCNTEGYKPLDTHTTIHTNWSNPLKYNLLNGGSIYQRDPSNYYIDKDEKYYCTFSSLEVCALYGDKQYVGTNFNGMMFTNLSFRVRPYIQTNVKEFSVGNWYQVDYNCLTGDYKITDTGKDGKGTDVIGVGDSTTNPNKWVTDTNTKYPTVSDTDYSGILTAIKSGFGLLGNDGVFGLLAATFSFVPKEIFAIIVTGVSLAILVFVLKFIRG